MKEGIVMKNKTKIDFIVSLILIICGSIIMLLPILNFTNVKVIFIFVMGIYIISNLINYFLVMKSKDVEGIYTALISLICVILLSFLDITKPLFLATLLFIWVFGMSLVKLKKADYYHDRENHLWIMHIITLFIFILIGLLTTINLYYSESVQILMLGNFFFINGILDLTDPLTNYLKEKN